MVHKRKVWNSSWLDPTGRDPTSQLKDGVFEHRVYCNNTEGILTVVVSMIPVITSFDVEVRMYQENFIKLLDSYDIFHWPVLKFSG
jgi:hypothetical protein